MEQCQYSSAIESVMGNKCSTRRHQVTTSILLPCIVLYDILQQFVFCLFYIQGPDDTEDAQASASKGESTVTVEVEVVNKFIANYQNHIA